MGHLPPGFHSVKGFEAFQKALSRVPAHGYEQVSMVLALGLAARDIVCSIEAKTQKGLRGVPRYVASSKLKKDHLKSLFENAPTLKILNTR
jgi:hypothetical protein